MKLGYAISSEEHNSQTLINLAKRAEEAGFSFSFISDHFHPWIDKQGQSSFVWAVLGGISQVTKTIKIGTGVTCPIIRTHPSLIAQAAATASQLMDGRFMLGLGTGENLNEHIVGLGWPQPDTRREMLIEAIEIIRLLWEGNYINYVGNYFTFEGTRIYSLPKNLPPILMAASSIESAKIAGRLTDGLISTSPSKELIKVFEENGGKGKPRYGQMKVCVDKDEAEGRKILYEWWPNGALVGPLTSDLPTPRHFEAAVKPITEEMASSGVPIGLDPKIHIQKIQEFLNAGFDHVYFHQVGPNQEEFFKFYEKEIIPVFA